ncbi:MAG: hypothetical protein KIT10_02985 [Flavobacteriales bacterium]|nr:hypothetical protein [Flavobacteriales bacterium]
MRAFAIIIALLSTGGLFAQGPVFPKLEGETADGLNVELPRTTSGRMTVIGIAYGQQAQQHLESWYEPAYLRFVAKHGLFAGSYEVDVWFVPLFTGLNKAAYEPTLKKFRKSAHPEIVKHVLFSKGDVAPLKDAFGMADKGTPYFFVLDGQGRVVYRTEGAFKHDKLDKIEEFLMD